MLDNSTLRILALQPGDHVGWFFETEAEHCQVLQSFLGQGLERGEKVIYLKDNHPPETILSYLGQDEVAVELYLQRGQLSILDAAQIYCPEGSLAPETMIQWLQTQTDQALAQGYAALRVTGEMTWTTHKLPTAAPLLEYEARLDHCLSDWPCLTLCQYDRRCFDAAWLLEILTAHPLLIIGTEMFHNIYHISQKEVPKPGRADVKLNNQISNLIKYKRAEQKLRESEQRYRLLAENVNDVIWTRDLNLKPIYISPSIKALRGFTAEEVMTQSLEDIFPPASLEAVKQALAEEWRLEQQEPKDLTRSRNLEVEQYCKDGSTVWTEIRASFLRDATGQPVGFLGTTRDITERRQAAQALKESENFLQNVFDAIQDGISVRDRHFNITKVNRAVEIWCAGEMPLIGKKCYAAFEHQPSPCPWCPAFAVMQTGQPHSRIVQHNLPDNQPAWFELTVFPIKDLDGQVSGTIEYAQDITARYRAEEALRESEARFRQLFEAAADAIFLHEAGPIIEVNQQACELLGYTREELLKLSAFDVDVGLPPEKLKERWQQQSQSPETYYDIFRRKDGSTLPVEIRVAPFQYQGRKMRLGIARDITERQKTESALKRREAVLAALSYAAEKFMQTPSWELYVQEVLGSLGEAMQVGRAYIFANQRGLAEEWLFNQTYAWVAPGITPRLANLPFQKLAGGAPGYDRWIEMLSQGQAIWGHVRELPPDAQEFLLSQDIKSFVMVPVFVDHQWWGVIGLDECFQEREWAMVELEALRVAASTLGAAIEHEQANKALQESERNLHFLTAELITAQERERQRISSELHNELGQSLMALKYHLRTLEKQLQPEQKLLQAEFESLFEYIDEVIDNVRRLCRDLSPAILEELGLTAALQYLVNDFKTYYEIQQCQGQIENIDSLFPPKWETIIYRVVQELLTNIGKHAEPTWVLITIKKINKEVLLMIADNGKGFNPEQRLGSETPKDGLGLLVIAERLRILGGQLDLQSQEHQGTKVTITIPIFVEGS
ncbi:MAG: PAS domain S-box protein [Desulfobacca sp.]|nr:PAS domain S-box protein [Desulfobacca sp.]